MNFLSCCNKTMIIGLTTISLSLINGISLTETLFGEDTEMALPSPLVAQAVPLETKEPRYTPPTDRQTPQDDFPQVRFAPPPAIINEGLNGTYDLKWKVHGWLHQGRLEVEGNFGNLILNVKGPNGKRIYAEEKMTIVPNENGYTLYGNTPTYPGSKEKNPDYEADIFKVESNDNGDWTMRYCLDLNNCSQQVKMTKSD